MSDTKKTMYRGVPFAVLREVAEVIDTGDRKYAPFDWVGRDKMDFFDALMRHIMEWRLGSTHDGEDGKHPLAHAIVNCMYIMEIEKREVGTSEQDDICMRSTVDGSNKGKQGKGIEGFQGTSWGAR